MYQVYQEDQDQISGATYISYVVFAGCRVGKNEANNRIYTLLFLLTSTICPYPRFYCTQAAGRKQGLPATWGKRTDADAGRNAGHGTATTYGRPRRKQDRETGGCGTNCRHRAPRQLQLQTGRSAGRCCFTTTVGGEQGKEQGQIFALVVLVLKI